jgi:hypothetical protein
VSHEEFTAGYTVQHRHKLAADLLVGLQDSSGAVDVYQVNAGDGVQENT